TNTSRKTIFFHYYDTLSDVFRARDDFEGAIGLARGQSVEKVYYLSSTAIGKYNVGPVKLYVEDPMKLCLGVRAARKITELKVSPATSEIHTQRSERLSNFVFTQGMHFSKKVGQGYDFYGLRNYDQSDDFRYIAWSRYGLINGEDLYIKQMEEERQIDVMFVLDYSINVNQGTPDRRMYDTVITTVINAAYAILKNRDGVGFSIDSSMHDFFIKPSKSEASIRQFEKTVADIRPMGQFYLGPVLDKIKKSLKKNALVLIISPFSYSNELSSAIDFKTGKRLFLFLLDPYDFVEMRDDDVYRKLITSTEAKHWRYLKGIAAFLNSVGIKTSISRRKDLYVRLMTEYSYGKMTNEGA
ncbi:MAG TPA: DUF58 domain-containing protein, partial [Thermoplasmataceae archaeon]|nr:DUF58 domain-containing protein [Thermoplasmataceae archaeon]